MEYLLEQEISQNLQDALNEINAISFEESLSVINDEIFLISAEHANRNFPDRISMTVLNSFAITQSFMHNGNRIHLIILNEQLCEQLNANITAVLLHEIGHIVNEFGVKIHTLQAVAQNLHVDELNERNKNIQLENEFHADFFAKRYGYQDAMVHNLTISMNLGYNDDEIASRIAELQTTKERITNRVRAHTI